MRPDLHEANLNHALKETEFGHVASMWSIQMYRCISPMMLEGFESVRGLAHLLIHIKNILTFYRYTCKDPGHLMVFEDGTKGHSVEIKCGWNQEYIYEGPMPEKCECKFPFFSRWKQRKADGCQLIL